jgi:hypothetical protein
MSAKRSAPPHELALWEYPAVRDTVAALTGVLGIEAYARQWDALHTTGTAAAKSKKSPVARDLTATGAAQGRN